jgi:putative endonuclease
MPVYYVYILECIDTHGKLSYYTGSTDDLVRRFDQHRQGKGARYTKGRQLKLVFFETFPSRSDAMKREYEIKDFSIEKKKELVSAFQNRIIPQ